MIHCIEQVINLTVQFKKYNSTRKMLWTVGDQCTFRNQRLHMVNVLHILNK